MIQFGRAPGREIVLDHRNVSRRHAEIRRRGPVVVLVDLDSTNGTIVNGRRVREHPLADGDRITLGQQPSHVRAPDDMSAGDRSAA